MPINLDAQIEDIGNRVEKKSVAAKKLLKDLQHDASELQKYEAKLKTSNPAKPELLLVVRKSLTRLGSSLSTYDSLHKESSLAIGGYLSLVEKTIADEKVTGRSYSTGSAAKDKQRIAWLAKHHKKALQHKAD